MIFLGLYSDSHFRISIMHWLQCDVLHFQENWSHAVTDRLKEKEVPRDVSEADAMLKRHEELYDEIVANRAKYELKRVQCFTLHFIWISWVQSTHALYLLDTVTTYV